MEQTVTVTFPHGCTKGGKDDAAEEGKGFTNLLEFIQFSFKTSCKETKREGEAASLNKLLVFVISLFPWQ